MAPIVTITRLDRWARILASERRAFPLALLLVLAFNLYWYGAFLSFPLFGEDAGALYSNLLETIKDGQLVTTRFPDQMARGPGQPNLFVTFTFDPVLLGDAAAARAGRILPPLDGAARDRGLAYQLLVRARAVPRPARAWR